MSAASLDDVLQPWGRHPLWVLPSGPLPPNPAEILGSHQMRDLLKSLQDKADIVVIDAPPLLPVTDSAVIARVTDGALLVVEARRTKREQVARSLAALKNVDAKVLGTVLNKAPARGPDADTYGYGSSYYSSTEEAQAASAARSSATRPRRPTPRSRARR